MIIFKWYDADEKEGNKKETDFEVENEDVISLTASLTAYTEHIGSGIDNALDLDESEKENIKRLMQAAFEAGIKKAFGEEKE